MEDTINQIIPPFSFGAVPSPYDYRDVKLTAVLGTPTDLPSEFFVDISKLPVWDQKKIGSCTGQAGGKYLQKFEEIENNRIVNLSPRFLYGMAKCLDNYSPEGTYPRLIMKVAQDYGCATEDTVPNNCDLSHEEYVYNRNKNNFPQTCWEDAKPYRIAGYAFPELTKEGLKQAVVQANGCMLLMRLGREWFTDKNGKSSWESNDILPLRIPNPVISGHEVYLYGYKDIGSYTKFYFLNSWSDRWCIKGSGWFDFDQYKPFINEAITAIDLPNHIMDEVKNLPKQVDFKYHFTHTLSKGDSCNDVKMLQIALKIEGVFPIGQKETGYYGDITQKAVLAYQKKYKVASLTELLFLNGKRVGPKTLANLNLKFNK